MENCWCGEREWKKVGINFNLYKVYFVVCFPFMSKREGLGKRERMDEELLIHLYQNFLCPEEVPCGLITSRVSRVPRQAAWSRPLTLTLVNLCSSRDPLPF